MDMNVDLSSYPKAQAPKSALEVASQLGGLQQQQQSIQSNALTIQNQKLDLANKQYGMINKEMVTLLNKGDSLTQDDIVNTTKNLVKAIPDLAEPMARFVSQIPTPQQIQQNPRALNDFVQNAVTRSQTVMDAVNYHLGSPGALDTGQTIQPTVSSPKFGIRSTGLPIQKQLPPGTPVIGPTGQPQALGAQPPQLAPGSVAAPPMRGDTTPMVPNRVQALPVGPVQGNRLQGQSNNFGGNVIAANVEPPQGSAAANVQNRFPQPSGPMTGQAPMFEEGQKQLAADQNLATEKLTQIKPILQALPLLDGLRSGPGTETWNKAIAFLKANNIISTAASNDPTAIYQEVNKKLSQYVSQSGVAQRSDAAQTLSEASSPSLSHQINPALIKLTRDAIMLDRVQAARSGAFVDQSGNQRTDLQNYGQHRSTFPAQMDERAFGLDLMKPSERQALLQEMDKKLNSKNQADRFEAQRFRKSLAVVDHQGLINTGGQ